MAFNITVQSLLSSALYDTYSVETTTTVGTLTTAIQSATGVEPTWYVLNYNDTLLTNSSATLGSYGITGTVALRSGNKISRLNTLELRQKSKLDLAALDRAASSNPRSTYDISQLPTQYDGNVAIDNPNPGGLIVGRPWINTVSTFTFYESFNTTVALETTQYVSGNKIYVYSSSFDVPGYANAQVIVNDIEVLNTDDRGHNMVVLDSYGDVVSITNYDTYGDPGSLTTLASALGSVASGNIVVLTVYDASALDAGVRSAINTNYGSTNSNTWAADRIDHIFIGIKS